MDYEMIQEMNDEYKKLIHDLRNMSTIIAGNCAIIESKIQEQGLGDIFQSLEKIKGTIKRVHETLSAKQVILTKINLNVMLKEICGSFDNPHILFIPKFSQGNLTVSGRYLELYQAFYEVIKNAVESCKHLEKPEIIVHTQVGGGKITVIIGNNGPHIPLRQIDGKETFKYIFDEGYTTKEGREGKGLAVVYRIMKEQDAIIGVRNIGFGGVQFSFTLYKNLVKTK